MTNITPSEMGYGLEKEDAIFIGGIAGIPLLWYKIKDL